MQMKSLGARGKSTRPMEYDLHVSLDEVTRAMLLLTLNHSSRGGYVSDAVREAIQRLFKGTHGIKTPADIASMDALAKALNCTAERLVEKVNTAPQAAPRKTNKKEKRA